MSATNTVSEATSSAKASAPASDEAIAPRLPVWGNRVANGVLAGLVIAYGKLWDLKPDTWWTDPLTVTVGIGLLIAIGWRFVVRRYTTYKEQWWLGEVAHRVAEAYDIEWSRIAQATRYRPMARGDVLGVFCNRSYRLKSKEDWWDGSPALLAIVVPTKQGDAITVFEQEKGKDPVQVPAGKPRPTGGSSASTKSPFSQAARRRKSVSSKWARKVLSARRGRGSRE